MEWYRDDSPERDRDYAPLIQHYDRLDAARKLYSEQFVDELFTKSEIDKLRKYVLDIREEDALRLASDPDAAFFTREVSLPVAPETMPFHALPVGGMTDRFILHERPGYDLKFKAAGYFNLANRTLPEKLEQSVRYVHRAMQSIGNDAGIKREQIEQAVGMLYRRDRLFVRRDAAPMDSVGKIELLE
jgi:hypothetical protein